MLALVIVVILSAFVGCSKPEQEAIGILSVRNTSSGKIVSIGDSRKEVNQVTGGQEGSIIDFPSGAERVQYMNKDFDSLGIYVDFFEDRVVAIRLIDEGPWETSAGVKVQMNKSSVEGIYAGDNYKASGLNGGMLLAYDAELAPVTFDEAAPYTYRISYLNGVVDVVAISDNLTYTED